MAKKKVTMVEVARSFAMKKNLGNYESMDFFASQKAEVPQEMAEETSEALYQFCKREVVKSYNDYRMYGLEGREEHERSHPPIVYKKGEDLDDKKEVMAEMQMDAKVEDKMA